MIKEILDSKQFKALVVLLIVIFVLFIIKVIVNGTHGYINNVAYYKVPRESVDYITEEEHDHYLFTTYSEYAQFLDDYGITGDLEPGDFQKRNYISYFVDVSDCNEKINGVIKVEVENKEATFYVDSTIYSCDQCDATVYLYLVPVSKEYTIERVKFKYNFLNDKQCTEDITVDKPILYLYPTNDIDVSVKLEYPERLLSTYPKYGNGWNVNVRMNGDMYDNNGKYYYALYWDEENVADIDFHEGFYVTKDNAIEFLEEKLNIIGLNDRERNEFIMYWLPKLENNGKSLVYFELTREREGNNSLLIEPKPDSILRVVMHVKKVEKKVNISEEHLDSFERNGFVAVEWGGVLHS